MRSSQEHKENLLVATDALLEAVEEQPESFWRLFVPTNQNKSIGLGLTARAQASLLLEAIASFPKALAHRFFAALHQILDEDDDPSADILQYAAVCTKAYVQASKKATLEKVTEVGQTAQILHAMIDTLATVEEEPARDAVLDMCEACWLSGMVGRELLLPLALQSWTRQAVDSTAILKKLWTLKEAFDEIDLGASDELRQNLVQLLSNRCVTKATRLLAYLASLDPYMMHDIHRSIRSQIPTASNTFLTAYGEIYYRMWSEYEVVRPRFEADILSELAKGALFARTSSLFKNIMRVSEPFCERLKDPQIYAMLYRQFGPVLWRSISSPNTQVRVHATIVLGNLFPLQPEFKDQDPGLDAFQTLLKDPYVPVRVAASKAAAMVMATYWSTLPPHRIRKLLDCIVSDHASDASSAAVRVGAVEAILRLLEEPQSHAVLRTLLPGIGNLIHDQSESVRLATIELLQEIKELQGFKYYEIVTVDQLTARLAVDGPKVAYQLCALLFNSVVPEGSEQKQRSRALKFIDRYPEAAIVFFGYMRKFVPDAQVVDRLALLLWEFFQENLDEPPIAVLEVVSILCEGAEDASEWFSGQTVAEALDYFSDEDDVNHNRARAAMLRIAGCLEESKSLVTYIRKEIAMGSGANVATYLTLLCSWDKSDEVAKSLKESIEAGFASDPDLKFGSPEPSTGKRRIGGSSRRDSDRLEPPMRRFPVVPVVAIPIGWFP